MNYRSQFSARKNRGPSLIAFLFISASLALVLGTVLQTHVTAAPVPHDLSFNTLGLGFGLGLAGLVDNKGRAINPISGINGVATGQNALINLPCNARYHRLVLNCTDSGSAAAVSSVISAMQILVNGTAVRDITPAQTIKIAQANGYTPLLGELPIFFSEPFPTGGVWNEPSDQLAWDMFGQNSFAIKLACTGTAPAITGNYEFDGRRNADSKGNLFLLPVNHKSFAVTVPSGQFDINWLPTTYPIRRMWFSVSAGSISNLTILQDRQRVLEGSPTQLRQFYRSSGFKLAQTDFTPFVNATGPAALGVSTAMEAITYFDAAAIFDVDARPWRALQVDKEMIVRITCSNAATLTVIMETLPGAYA